METLEQRLRRREGSRAFVYDDATGKDIVKGSIVKGNPTIGIGILLSLPGGITKDEIELLFQNRVRQAVRLTNDALPWLASIEEPRRSVPVEMAFCMGLHGMLGFEKFLAAFEARDWQTAAAQILDSDWHRNDLTASRAEEMAGIVLTGSTDIKLKKMPET